MSVKLLAARGVTAAPTRKRFCALMEISEGSRTDKTFSTASSAVLIYALPPGHSIIIQTSQDGQSGLAMFTPWAGLRF